jgi:hypothetical protein
MREQTYRDETLLSLPRHVLYSKSVQRRKLIVKTAAVLLICLELGQFFSQGADPPPPPSTQGVEII